MDTVLQNNQIKGRWLFELEDNGTVFYSSPHQFHSVDGQTNNIVGLNFFDQVTGFGSDSELYKRFQMFVKGRKSGESFSLQNLTGYDSSAAKIVRTRTYQHGPSTPSGIVMLEIKEDT